MAEEKKQVVPICSLIHFRVKPGSEAAFETAFASSGMLTRPRAVTGFIAADLLRDPQGSSEYYVLGRWTSEAAYAEWQARSLEGASTEALTALFDTLVDPRPGRVLSIVQSSDDILSDAT